MPEERVTPYIWVSWLTKLMVGESMCEWAAWFKAWNESWSYKKMPSDLQIVMLPGNHDAVRLMEPQLPLPDHVKENFQLLILG